MKKIKLPNQRMLNQTLALVSKRSGKKVMEHFKSNFAKGGYEQESGQFVRWAKRKKQYKHPILKDTKKLQKSFKLKVKKGTIIVENVAPYAGYVQEGSSNNAERPIVYHSKELDEIVLKEINKAVLGMLGL